MSKPVGPLPQLKRFLAKLPDGVSEGVLQSRESYPMVLGRWKKEALVPELADDIMETVESYDASNPGVTCILSLLDEQGKPIVQRPLEATRAPMEDDSAPFQPRGDNMAQASNAQRHLEVMMRQVWQQNQATNEALRSIAKDLAAQITDERKSRMAAQQRADALAEELRRIEISVPVSEDDQTAEMQKQVLEVLKPLMPAIAMKLLGAGAVTPAPSK